MRTLTYLLAAGLLLSAGPLPAQPLIEGLSEDQLVLQVQVPIDHSGSLSGSFPIHVELGAAFDGTLPTVFLIADEQQFFVRPGAIAALQKRLFGDGFNVVGIYGRHGFADDPRFRALIQPEGKQTNWRMAWSLFRARQWIEDIEFVRRAVFGDGARIMLFGRSGGGYLVHQYLHAYPDQVARAFTSAPAATWWAAYGGLELDSFWDELGRSDPTAQARLRRLIETRKQERHRIASAFQRQNFFVSHADITAARLDLLATFESGDRQALDQVYDNFQVTAVERLLEDLRSVPTRVRLFEFALPFLDSWAIQTDVLQPDVEVMLAAAGPLLELGIEGELAQSGGHGGGSPAAGESLEVFVLAGRWDHVVDYRAALALSASYSRSYYWLADDNHTFDQLVATGHYAALLQTFLAHGLDSRPLDEAREAARDHRWSAG